MNYKAQEIHFGAAVMGLVGGGIAFFLATRMGSSILFSAFIGIIGVIACYLIAAGISSRG